MAVFDRLSRYIKPVLTPYAASDTRNREVSALPTPEQPVDVAVGAHAKREGQTLDQLANGYLSDPHGYWRIAELNDAMLPDALEEREIILIPTPNR